MYAGTEVGARVVRFAITIVLAHVLLQRDYGAWGLLTALIGLAAVVFEMGLGGVSARWYFDRPEPAFRRLVFTLLMLWGGASLLLVLLMDQVSGAVFDRWVDLSYIPCGRVALAIAWCTSAAAIPMGILLARRRTAGVSLLSLGITLAPTLGILVVLVSGPITLENVLWGQLVGIGGVAVVALFLGVRMSSPGLERAQIVPVLAYGLPLVPHLLAQWVLASSDRYLLEHFLGLEMVAVYSLAYQIGTATPLLIHAVNRAWYPVLFRDLTRLDEVEPAVGGRPFSQVPHGTAGPTTEEGREIWRRVRTHTSAVAVLIVVVGLGVALFGDEILRPLLPDGYGDATLLIAPIGAGTMVYMLYLVPMNQLMFIRRNAMFPVMTLVAAVANIGLNLWLIPLFGARGAALATLAAYGVLLAICFAVARRRARSILPLAVGSRVLAAVVVGSAAAIALAAGEHEPLMRWGAKLSLAVVLAAVLFRGDLLIAARDLVRQRLGRS